MDFNTIISVTPDVPTAGTWTIVGTPGQPDHMVEFTATPGYFGPAGYNYTVQDTDGQQSTAHVDQEVLPTSAPQAVNDTFPPISRDSGPVLHDVLGNDDPGA